MLTTVSIRKVAATLILLLGTMLWLTGCGSGGSVSVPVSTLTISTTALAAANVGVTYSSTILAVNGTKPYTFGVTTGAPPTGLSLSAAGALTGVPTQGGTFNFTVSVTDAVGAKASLYYTMAVAGTSITPVSISTTSLVGGTVGTPYSATVAAINGVKPYSFAVTSGAVPAGLSLSSVGVLAGTPTASGTSTFIVTVTDASGAKATQGYSVAVAAFVNPAQVVLDKSALVDGVVNVAYGQMFTATGGTKPYSFAVSAGTLPGGYTLSSAGVLSGTATVTGTYTFTVKVTDAAGSNDSGSFTLTIDAVSKVLTIGTALPAPLLNTSYSAAIPISGGVAPYTVTLKSGAVPAGLTLSSAGVLAGTPTTAGTYTFGIGVSDSSATPITATANFTVAVATATVLVDTTTALATVPAGFYGLHTSVYDDSLGDTAATAAMLKAAGVTTLRYPGGSFSDRYHWAQYSLTPLYTSTNPSCGIVPGELYLGAKSDFGNFVRLAQAGGANALITVNYGTSVADKFGTKKAGTTGLTNNCSEPNTAGQPQEAAAWVAFANGSPSNTTVIGLDAVGFDWKTVGYWASLRAATPLATDDGFNFLRLGLANPIGIKRWELGNEMYYNGWAGNRNFEADIHAPYIYPNGYSPGAYLSRDQLAALSPTAYGTNAAPFIAAMKAVDPTIQIGLDFSSPIYDDPIPANWNTDVPHAACAMTNFDLAIIHYYPGTYLAVQPSELLSFPQVEIPNVVSGIKASLAQYCPANAANMRFVLSETNPNATLAPGFPLPVLGLFAINEYLTAAQQGILNVDYLELHDQAGSFLTLSEQPGPVFYGLQMANQLATPGDALVKATSSTSTVISYAALKANGQKGVLLINADPSNAATVQVTVTGATLGTTGLMYSFGVGTTQSTNALVGSSFTVPGNTFGVTVPAYQAVEVIVP